MLQERDELGEVPGLPAEIWGKEVVQQLGAGLTWLGRGIQLWISCQSLMFQWPQKNHHSCERESKTTKKGEEMCLARNPGYSSWHEKFLGIKRWEAYYDFEEIISSKKSQNWSARKPVMIQAFDGHSIPQSDPSRNWIMIQMSQWPPQRKQWQIMDKKRPVSGWRQRPQKIVDKSDLPRK